MAAAKLLATLFINHFQDIGQCPYNINLNYNSPYLLSPTIKMRICICMLSFQLFTNGRHYLKKSSHVIYPNIFVKY